MEKDRAVKPVEPSPADTPGARCARDGCGNALPTREADERGRRKAGRQGRFCSAACRAAAHRARSVTYNTAAGDALRQVSATTDALLPMAEQWTAQLGALTEQLRRANESLVDQVQAADQHAEEARAAAAESEQRATDALNQRDQALRDTRAAQNARQAAQDAQRAAEAEAAQQLERAQDIERQAWQRVAEHEAARGGAEQAARDAEQRARDAEQRSHESRQQAREVERQAEQRAQRDQAAHDELARRLSDLQTSLAAHQHETETLSRRQDERIAELERLLAERDSALRAAGEQLAAVTAQAQAERIAQERAHEAAALARADGERARDHLEQAQAAREQAVTELNDLRLQLVTSEAVRNEERIRRQAAEARITDLLGQRDDLKTQLADLTTLIREPDPGA